MSARAQSFLDRARGQSPTQIAVTGVGGYLLALSAAFIQGALTVVDFLLLPFTLGIDIAGEAAQQLIITPLGLTDFGLIVSAQALPEFGIAGLPVSVIVIVITLLIVAGFFAFSITGNVPGSGLFLDNPLVDFFSTTPEEEFNDED